MAKVNGKIYRKGIQRCLDVPKPVLPKSVRDSRPAVVVRAGALTFESTLLPRDARCFQLVVPMAVLRSLGRDDGDRLEISIHLDPHRDAPPVPVELSNAMRLHPRAPAVFAGLTVAKQREIVRYIDSARSDRTRVARAEDVVTRFLRLG
jgi:bifunctional DNA-binding transcriptional regulator/antitoxin component of YhaV-PrlF toxin-antitoxin module